MAVEAAFSTYERDREAVGNVLAGAVAFRLFVYLLPVVLVAIALLGILVSFDPNSPEDLSRSVGMSTYLVTSVGTAADQSHKSLWVLVPLAIIAVVTAGSAAAKVVRAISALAWRQPITRMRHIPGAAAAAFGVAFIAVLVLAVDNRLRSESPVIAFTAAIASGFVFFVVWLGVSLLLPHGDAPWKALIPGAILVASGIQALHLVSLYYLGSRIQSSSELYGPLGAGAAMLGFLYLVGRLLVAGAMLNATLYDLKTRRSET